jgi:glucosylceramidase
MKVLALFVVLALVAVVLGGSSVNVWLTSSDSVTAAAIKLLEPQETIGLSASKPQADISIAVDTSSVLQKILGYGAGLPQASASVLINLKRQNSGLYNEVMERLFGSSAVGASISAVRFPVGSCDFSIQNTTYDESYNDYDLSDFAIDPDSEMIVEVLKDAKVLNPALTVIGKMLRMLLICGQRRAYSSSHVQHRRGLLRRG